MPKALEGQRLPESLVFSLRGRREGPAPGAGGAVPTPRGAECPHLAVLEARPHTRTRAQAEGRQDPALATQLVLRMRRANLMGDLGAQGVAYWRTEPGVGAEAFRLEQKGRAPGREQRAAEAGRRAGARPRRTRRRSLWPCAGSMCPGRPPGAAPCGAAEGSPGTLGAWGGGQALCPQEESQAS